MSVFSQDFTVLEISGTSLILSLLDFPRRFYRGEGGGGQLGCSKGEQLGCSGWGGGQCFVENHVQNHCVSVRLILVTDMSLRACIYSFFGSQYSGSFSVNNANQPRNLYCDEKLTNFHHPYHFLKS